MPAVRPPYMIFSIVLSFVFSHWLLSFFSQYIQLPQAIWKLQTTRSPGFTLETPGPTLSTTPQNSWPSMSPFCSSMTAPWYKCRSEPQMVEPVTLTMTSVFSILAGLKVSTNLTEFFPFQTRAFIFSPDGSAYFSTSFDGLDRFCSVVASPVWPTIFSRPAAAWESVIVCCMGVDCQKC